VNGKIQRENRGESIIRASIGHELIPVPTVRVGIDGAVRRRSRFIGIALRRRLG
jgi:hypothetical protein